MKVRVLALDYDGTIASAGALDPDVRAALEEARSRGIIVIIVTGRMLDDFRAVAGGLQLADAVVAENGAVVALSACESRSLRLAPSPAPELIQDLRARGFHVDAGESVIAAPGSIAHDVLQSIRRHALPLVLVFNGESLMVLPQSVSKGTGLRKALRLLGESRHNAVGIGDRENDHDLLRTCGTGVAVGWGSEALKSSAQIVIDGTGPPSVGDFLLRMARDPWIPPSQARPELVPLGHVAGRPLSLPVHGRNVMVVGDANAGISWLAGLISEHLILNGYSVCVIDGEGAQKDLATLPSVLLRRIRQSIRPAQIVRALTRPEQSLVVDVSRFSNQHRSEYVRELLTMMTSQRRRVGRPHWIVIDAADQLSTTVPDAEFGGYVLACSNGARMSTEIWSTIEACVATRMANPDDVTILAERLGASNHEGQWRQLIGELAVDEAVILSYSDHPTDTPTVFRIAERLNCLRRGETHAHRRHA